jgi:hypothetical protein
VNLLVCAESEARRLNHGVATDGHLLLALLRSEPGPAQEALHAVGYRAEDCEVRLSALLQRESAPGFTTFSPRMYVLQGRAEAFAASFGAAVVTPEHALLAMMWDDHPTVWQRDGADVRPEVLALLRSRGVSVPETLPPALAPGWTQRVALADPADWRRVCDHLQAIAPGHWGTNPLNPGPDSVSTFVASAYIDLLAETEGLLGPGKARAIPLTT